MSVIKVAITGKLRSGKSTAASHLVLNHGFERVSFGGALSRYADELFDGSDVYPTEYVEIESNCPFGSEPVKIKRKNRRLLQDFGEAMRALDPHIWIRHAESLVEYYADKRSTRGIVIDDLRQPNEEAWARANGFIIVRVNANEDTRIARAKEAGDDFGIEDLRHGTELHVDDIEADYDVWNDGEDRAELERKIDELMSEIKSGRESVI